ncbi:hypothetical protein ACIPW5_26025 [Streptomyces sp. NPDC090077]|uniref:hypothetical protein n=1 Tax=Streptomyces sp. NPDC090077 TaxID=3365938 RepID=UPI003827C1B3
MLEEELLRRARAGRLRHRDMYTLLFDARGARWDAVRRAALERAAAMPPAAATMLHWYAEQHNVENGLTYEEQSPDPEGRHQVCARLRAEQDWAGSVRTAWSRKTARHYAACALLAQMSALPEPTAPVRDEPAPHPLRDLVASRISGPLPGRGRSRRRCPRAGLGRPD